MAVPPHADDNRVYTRDGPSLTHVDQRAPLDQMPAGSFESSNVHSAIYDFGERTLFVRYLREGADAIYQYWDVPAAEWDGLKLAASKGSYINANIATDYRYALFGRDDFPERSALNDQLRRFVYSA
jgi:hypothetical protein